MSQDRSVKSISYAVICKIHRRICRIGGLAADIANINIVGCLRKIQIIELIRIELVRIRQNTLDAMTGTVAAASGFVI